MGTQEDAPTERVDDNGASVSYLLGGCWRVTLSASHGVPWDGPEGMTVEFVAGADDAQEAVGAAEASNGISTEVLRSVPLADARLRLRRLRARRRMSGAVAAMLQARCTGPKDWARFAYAYGEVAKVSKQPLASMAEASGVNRRTLAARASKARELGYLTTPTGTNLGELTTKGRKALGLRKGQTDSEREWL